MVCIVFIGIQGSGKGTQAKMLKEKLGFEHINIGELLREEIEKKSDIGNDVKKVIGAGQLVDDDIVIKLIQRFFLGQYNGIILDGFPRNTGQAEYLTKKLSVDKVFFFNLPDEIAIKRLNSRRICKKCGRDYNLLSKRPISDERCDLCNLKLIIREDDTKKAISKRLASFHKYTKQLISYYRKEELLHTIDAEKDAISIHEEIIKTLQYK